jgi:hypothetical protein
MPATKPHPNHFLKIHENQISTSILNRIVKYFLFSQPQEGYIAMSHAYSCLPADSVHKLIPALWHHNEL